MRKNIVYLYILIGLATSAKANETQKLYRSADFLSRGNAGITSPKDEDAIFYNPAGLWRSNRKNNQTPTQSAEQTTSTTENQIDPAKIADKAIGESPETSSQSESKGNLEATTEPPEGESNLRKVVILAPMFVVSSNIDEIAGVSGDAETLDAVRNLVGKPVHAGIENFSGALIGNMAFGLLSNMDLNVLVFKDGENSGIETVRIKGIKNIGVTGSYAYSLLADSLIVGVTGKIIQREMTYANISIANVDALTNFKASEYQNTGTGFGLDMGAIYFIEHSLNPRLGLTLSDIGDTSFAADDGIPVESIRQTLNLGTSIAPETPFVSTRVFFDIRDLAAKAEENLLKRVHLGSDFIYDGFLGMGIGLNQGFTTAGFYYLNQFFRFDLGSYAEETSDRVGERPSRRYFLRLMSTL